MDETRPSQPGEGRVDLGELGSPDRVEIFPHRARELVTGARFLAQETEEDFRKRHERTISN
jgi:hypothetical protein